MRIIRLLPATIITATFLFGIKVMDVMQGAQSLLIPNVEAQQEAKPNPASTDKPPTVDHATTPADPKKPDDAKPAADAKPDDAKPTDVKPADAKEGDKKEGDKKEGEKKEKANPNVSDTPGETTDNRYTAVELELLQNLGKRREELDHWEANIQIKEAALNATEKRIDDKIEQIDTMKKEIAALLAQYNTQEDAKIKSLVKIYENMKPADAARIFDEVEEPILLLVIDMMSEKKAAPILAAMNAKKAKQLTVDLANERKLNSNKMSAAAATLPNNTTPSAPTPAPPPTPPIQ